MKCWAFMLSTFLLLWPCHSCPMVNKCILWWKLNYIQPWLVYAYLFCPSLLVEWMDLTTNLHFCFMPAMKTEPYTLENPGMAKAPMFLRGPGLDLNEAWPWTLADWKFHQEDHGCCLQRGREFDRGSLNFSARSEVRETQRSPQEPKESTLLGLWNWKRERALQSKCRLRGLWWAKGNLSICGKGVWHLSDCVLLMWAQSYQRATPQCHGEWTRSSSGQTQKGKFSLWSKCQFLYLTSVYKN